jgi:hypothetical protein
MVAGVRGGRKTIGAVGVVAGIAPMGKRAIGRKINKPAHGGQSAEAGIDDGDMQQITSGSGGRRG